MTAVGVPNRRAYSAVRTASGQAIVQRASRLVGSASLDTAAVPDAAVLLVRRLTDPLPRRIVSYDGAPVASPGWERALRANIADCYRTAARPARAPVASDVNAVCFEDRAELLACLLRDALAGAVSERWWWRAFLRTIGSDANGVLGTFWREDAALVPAVLERLAHTGHALPLVNALSPPAATRALQDVAMAFDLPAIAAPVALVGGETSHALPYIGVAATGTAAAAGESDTGSSPPPPPWSRAAPDVPLPPAVTPECAALLGVALVLARAPLHARRRDFARQFHTWRLAVGRQRAAETPAHADATLWRDLPSPSRPTAGEPVSQARVVIDTPISPITAAPPAREGVSAPGLEDSTVNAETVEPRERLTTIAERPRTSDIVSEPTPVIPLLPGGAVRVDRTAPPEARSGGTIHSVTQTGATIVQLPVPCAVAVELPLSADRSSVLPSTDSREQVSAGVATELGGTLFLINALLHLRFFDLLDDHFGVAATCGGWGWLELCARALLGEKNTWAATDPIWRALAELDGRENGERFAGDLLVAQPEYRLPVSWVDDVLAGETLRPAVRRHGNHLQLWHQSQFVIADWSPDGSVPTRDAARDFALARWPDLLRSWPPLHTKAARRRAARRSAFTPLDLKPDVRLARFMEFVLPYLRLRLAQSLGRDELDELSASQLLRRRGWLYVTRSHVDLRCSLDTVDVSTRRAGLDANPGWVPQLGRVVTFFFDVSDS